jgi:hypothetical protein
MSPLRRWWFVAILCIMILCMIIIVDLHVVVDEQHLPFSTFTNNLATISLTTTYTRQPFEIVNRVTLTPTKLATPTTVHVTENSMPTDGQPCIVSVSGGLITEIQSIMAAMQTFGDLSPNSNEMVVPTTEQMDAWESIIQNITLGYLTTACDLIWANQFPYHLVEFTDIRNNSEIYVILRENLPNSVGWGTYVVRTGGAVKPIIVEVPHPIADENTEVEGVEIFRQLHARALLLAGTHRCANQAFSTCVGQTIACGVQEPYRVSDVAHTLQSMFQAAHQALVICGEQNVVIQVHGNGLFSCPDLFISNGTIFPGNITHQIYEQARQQCQKYIVDIADDSPSECAFNGGASVQAIYTNSCSSTWTPTTCDRIAPRPKGSDQFISLEQSPAFRKDFDCLLQALMEVFNITK